MLILKSGLLMKKLNLNISKNFVKVKKMKKMRMMKIEIIKKIIDFIKII